MCLLMFSSRYLQYDIYFVIYMPCVAKTNNWVGGGMKMEILSFAGVNVWYFVTKFKCVTNVSTIS